MNQRYLLSALLLGLLSFGASINANANSRQFFETRICRGCDYNHAMNTAAAIKPAINCTGASDPFNPDTAQAQACYATPINILVIDADSRNMWQFENTYSNQGQPIYNLANEVNYYSLISIEVSDLANQLLDMYELMNQFAAEQSGSVDVSIPSGADIHAPTRSPDINPDSCEDYAMGSALSDAFSGAERARLKLALQKIVNEHPSIGVGLVTSKLLSANFSVSTSGVSMGGSWQDVDNPIHITKLYGPDNPDGLTQVTFSATMANGLVIKMALNEDLTVFDGMPLNILKEQRTSSRLIKKCLADTLDAMYPKLVTGSGRTSPSFNNVALVDGG